MRTLIFFLLVLQVINYPSVTSKPVERLKYIHYDVKEALIQLSKMINLSKEVENGLHSILKIVDNIANPPSQKDNIQHDSFFSELKDITNELLQPMGEVQNLFNAGMDMMSSFEKMLNSLAFDEMPGKDHMDKIPETELELVLKKSHRDISEANKIDQEITKSIDDIIKNFDKDEPEKIKDEILKNLAQSKEVTKRNQKVILNLLTSLNDEMGDEETVELLSDTDVLSNGIFGRLAEEEFEINDDDDDDDD